MSGLCKIFGKDIFKIISKESKFFSRPVDPHMQRPPRGGIWVGVTCDISKSNCKLFNCHYSDSIILNNTVQIIIHHIDQYDNIHQFIWTSTHLIAVIMYFPATLCI
ncbi:hypothetical protein V1478_002274 [Vespula squamosa]|uniref:Uncharacterized protein n=1 Tax=Vespula squamosa TaxID=30214 RepID=A0ABD2BW12_VESSQ